MAPFSTNFQFKSPSGSRVRSQRKPNVQQPPRGTQGRARERRLVAVPVPAAPLGLRGGRLERPPRGTPVACVRLPPPSPRRLRRGKMGTDVGVLYGPLGGRSRHKQGHKRSRERAVAAPSSIAVLKPHLLYLLVSDTHAVTSDTRPHYEPTTASQNRQVISNPNAPSRGDRRSFPRCPRRKG